MDVNKALMEGMIDAIQEELDSDDPQLRLAFANMLATYYTMCIWWAQSLEDWMTAFRAILHELRDMINVAMLREKNEDEEDFVGSLRW